MTRFKHDLILRIIKTLDAVLITVPFALCWYLYYAKHIASPFYAKGDYLVVALFFALFIIFGRVYDAFLMSMQRISEIVYAQFLAVAVSDFIMYIVIWLLSKHLPNILPGVAALIGQVILAAVWAYNAHHAYFKIFPLQATAVIYDTRQGMEKLIGKYGLDDKYKVVLTATADECIANLAMLDGVSTVFMSGIHSHDRNVILKYCVENNIGTFVIPRIGDTIMSGAYPMHMFHLPMLKVGRYHPQPEYLFIKRLLDIVISAVALVVLSPIFLITAIAIKATDHGPVFYKQIRLTKDGKEFGILKFRSMRVDAEKDGVARLSSGDNDSRITPVGRIIRKIRVDELPQHQIDFLKQLPTTWDETKFIDGYPTKYAVVARKSGGKWYVGGINGTNEARQLTLNLPMLAGKTVQYYLDKKAKKGQMWPDSELRTLKVDRNGKAKVTIQPMGGIILVGE